MAKKRRKKEEQTFNVYPYLGGYQHFMRNGGALPKFEEEGAVDASVIANRIKPHNKYGYANTYKGVVDEWKANNDPNYVPRGSFMGQVANTIQATGDFGKTVMGAFDKDNYKPGGKYSKIQTNYVPGTSASCDNAEYKTEEECVKNGAKWTEAVEGREDYAGLKYANQTITNTTGDTRIMNQDNLARYMNMSKKEKKEFIESGGRNTDLFWTPEETAHGKWNYMDLNEDGTPRYEGLNLEASTLRGDVLEEQTGDRMFSNKTRVKQPDGSYKFVYFDKDGNVSNNQVPTEYDLIEEGTGAGQLGDANATHMNISYEVDGSQKPIGIDDDGMPIYPHTDPSNNQMTSFDHYVKDQDGKIVLNEDVKYDPTKEYGDYSEHEKFKSNKQAVIECEKGLTCPGKKPGKWIPDADGGRCECPTGAQYGTEVLNKFVYGGTLPKYQGDEEGSETIPGQRNPFSPAINCKEPEGGCPEGQAFDKKACTCKSAEIDMGDMTQDPYGVDAFNINETPTPTFENPPVVMMADESENSPSPEVPVASKYDLVGITDPTKAREKAGEFTCSDGVSKTREECEANDGTWNDPKDMGIDNNYGKGPLEKTWNKSREFLNTGVMGALGETLIGGSAEQYCDNPEYKTKEECEKEGAKWIDQKGTGAVSLLFDNIIPMAENIMGQNAERKDFLHKRSVSSGDLFAATESGSGSGQKGFYDVNKGGYGDDLYGTGKIFGQSAQQGIEMPEQSQRDLSGVPSYMDLEDGLTFDLEFLKEQKNYLGKMSMGGHLPRFQSTGETVEEFIADGKKKINAGHYVEPSSNSQEGLNYGNSRVSSETYGSTNTESVNGENTKFQDDFVSNFNIENAAGADNVTVNRSAIGKLFNKNNVKVANTNKRRDVRKIQDKYGMSPDELIASGEYTMNENGELVSTPRRSSSWAHSSNEGGWKNGNFEESFGSFTHPNAANNNQGSFATSLTDNQDMSYDESSKTYWDNIGQYSTGEDNIYSNPENAGSFLPEVKVKGRYGGHLPRFQDGKEKPWYSKAADYVQTGLSGVGLTPGPVGFVSDAVNTFVSGTRAGYNTAIGDTESAKIHGENLALNATSMIPGPAGWVAGGTAIAKDMANYSGVTDGNKSVGTQITEAVTEKPKFAENLNTGPKKVGTTARHGGEQHAEIDMDLYYELMQAGADMKIIR